MDAVMVSGGTDVPLRVLVVEDDPDLRVLVRAVLRDLVSEFDQATSGDEAIEKIAAHSYDVVLLDLMLPRQNGFEVYKAIQQMKKRPRVIVVSAIARYFDDRFDDDVIVLQKPFTNEALLEAVRGSSG
jgi:CheY-like chemotaxis protein